MNSVTSWKIENKPKQYNLTTRVLVSDGEINTDPAFEEINYSTSHSFNIEQISDILHVKPLSFSAVITKSSITSHFRSVASSIEFGVTNLLEAYLDNNVFEDFINHGCWCARFNSERDQSYLGGSKILDLDNDGIEDDFGLDSLCKQWITSRRCNKLPNGSCEGETEISPYNIDLSFSPQNYTCLDTANTCLADNCEIDAYFATEIFNLIELNGVNLLEAEDGDCREVTDGGSLQKQCSGTVPDALEIIDL